MCKIIPHIEYDESQAPEIQAPLSCPTCVAGLFEMVPCFINTCIRNSPFGSLVVDKYFQKEKYQTICK